MSCNTVDPTAVRTELDGALQNLPKEDAELAQLTRQWYAGRDYLLTWSKDKDADAAIAVLQSVVAHGLEPDWYGVQRIVAAREGAKRSRSKEADYARVLAAFDVSLTSALLHAGRDVAIGRVRPETINRHWKRGRALPDLAGTLSNAVATGTIAGWLEAMAPRHVEYADLRRWLAALRQQPVPSSDPRVNQILVNLDRVRWLPDDLGAHHLVVNIPEFMLRARDAGRTALEMRVVVGKPGGNETPPLSGALESVVFNPYWNLPESIVLAETLPALSKDPEYLDRHDMEVLRTSAGGTKSIDPDDIDWNDPVTLKQVRIRQRPGSGNALGEIKFPFKNEQAIYLHDTPSAALFQREVRAFSHGCVRVAEPVALARHLLSRDPAWTEDRIAQAIRSSEESHANVRAEVWVHLIYLTAVAGYDGGPKFLKDVYGYDRTHLALRK